LTLAVPSEGVKACSIHALAAIADGYPHRYFASLIEWFRSVEISNWVSGFAERRNFLFLWSSLIKIRAQESSHG
jgi:hypothetical protein